MKKIFLKMMFLLVLSFVNAFANVELIAKDIEVVPIKKTEPYIEYLFTHKKEYHVREPIKFVLKLRKNAYIYIINISKRNHQAYKLLPNKYQKYNYYKAGIKYVIPSKNDNYSFVPDSVGEEIVYVIASEKKLDNLPSFRNFRTKGGFFEEATEKEAEKLVKDIKVIPKEQSKMEIKKIIIPIKPKLKKQIFVSTGKYIYSNKESISVFVKKNFDESVSIFLYKENGKIEKLKTIKKKKTQFKIKPHKNGFYKVIAVYSQENVSLECLKNNFNLNYVEPLKCINSNVYNIHTFLIRGE